MKATILDLRRRMSKILRALDHNESVKIFYRGKEKAILFPVSLSKISTKSAREHSTFGMWENHEDIKNVADYVRDLRGGRYHDV